MDGLSYRRLLLILTAGTYALVGLLTAISGIRADYSSFYDLMNVLLAVGALSIAAARLRMPRIRASVECFGCGVLLVPPLLLASYLAASMHLPLADAELAKADAMLGFDWTATIVLIDKHPLIAGIFNYAYRSFSIQLVFWPLVLCYCGKQKRAYEMMSVYAIICLLCSLVSMWWPALGTYTYYDFDGTGLQNLDTTYGYHFIDQFNAVRENPHFVWSLEHSAGIVTFPSGHAAIAVACGWAAWELKWIRYPAAALNVAMAISAVPSANHYLVDVIAGVLVAAVSIAAVSVTGSQWERSRKISGPVSA